jgi:hypothetical protein
MDKKVVILILLLVLALIFLYYSRRRDSFDGLNDEGVNNLQTTDGFSTWEGYEGPDDPNGTQQDGFEGFYDDDEYDGEQDD